MTEAAGAGGRRALPWVVLVLVLLGAALLAGRPESARPLDPRSTRPDGARGLVLLLEALGARVDVVRGAPPAGATTALVLDDRLAAGEVGATLDWVEAGGVLVSTDLGGSFPGPGSPTEACPAVLEDVRELTIGEDTVGRGGFGCLGGAVEVVDRGEGTIVGVAAGVDFDVLGGELRVDAATVPFNNALLDEADNAVLAAVLLAPTDGARVAILDGPGPGGGDLSLFDLVSRPLRQALFQLLVVAGVFVLWRGRRLGRPVVETQPVAIAGSELVVAVGRLLDGRRRPDEAAATLRADLRRALEIRLGVPAGAPTEAAAAAVAARTGLDPEAVGHAIAAPVTTDADLVAVAAQLDRIRQLALG